MITILSDNNGDQDYKDDEFIISDPLRAYTEQIKMALETENGSILGSDNFFDLEALVYEQNLSEIDIRNKVVETISGFCSLYENFSTDINVAFAKGTIRDICLIDVIIDSKKSIKVVIK